MKTNAFTLINQLLIFKANIYGPFKSNWFKFNHNIYSISDTITNMYTLFTENRQKVKSFN